MTHWGTSFASNAHLLRLLTPDGAEQIIALLDRQELKIGSSPEADLCLKGPGIAPRHCRIFEQGGRLFLVDHGSPAGTLIDDRRCIEPTVLREDQRISIGYYLLVVLPGRAHLGTEAIARELAYDPGGWDESRDYFLQRLEQGAAAWEARGRPQRLLLRGDRLARAATLSALPPSLEPWIVASASHARTRQGLLWFLAGLLPGLLVGTCLALPVLSSESPPPPSPPPPSVLPPSPTPARCKPIEHHVIPGETLEALATHYDVDALRLAHDNKLDPFAPLAPNTSLIVCSFKPAVARYLTSIRVQAGDTWESLADAHGLTLEQLLAHYPGLSLKAGAVLSVWTDKVPRIPEPTATPLVSDALAISSGRPVDGELVGVHVPDSPLWHLRCRRNAYGTSHAINELTRAIYNFRERHAFRGELIVADWSRREGGSYGPHVSHQSGRDVDLWLPVHGGLYTQNADDPACNHCGTSWCRPTPAQVDWELALGLVQALDATGSVKNIFLDRQHFDALRQAARDAGLPDPEIDRLIQPRPGIPAVVTHEARHTRHFHIRFRCGPHESACKE